MRPSLNNIERIDNYLNGNLSESEKIAFEKEVKENSELQQQMQIQQDLIKTANRIGIKKEIKKISKGGGSHLGKWLFGGILIAAITTGSFFYFNRSAEIKNTPVPQKIEELKIESAQNNDSTFNGLHTWVNPTVQSFAVDPKKGATIEGKEGTLIIVPANAFVDENNKTITEAVQFELVEALTLEDMILYNLATTSNGKPLETGGMLHIKTKCNNKEVKINPARPLYIEVPTNEVKKDMMAFEGEVQKNGKLNWVNPKPLKKYLVNVPFETLDFLPEGFEEKVKTFIPYKNYKVCSKNLVDSLYYSLGIRSSQTNKMISESSDLTMPAGPMPTTDSAVAQVISYGPIGSTKRMSQKYTATSSNIDVTNYSECGIKPLSIKTIKTPTFSQTFLATKEFEDRVAQLHQLENGDAMLKLYIDNLAKDLSQVDSIVSKKISGKSKSAFEKFAAQKLTNIKDTQIYQAQLSAYYSQKRQEYNYQMGKLKTELEKANNTELNQLYQKLNGKQMISDKKYVNLLPANSVATSNSYAFTWAKNDWVNIDCYLHILEGRIVSVNLSVPKTTGTSEVYQWLNTIKNLTPLQVENGAAKAVFPDPSSIYAQQMKNTFCISVAKNGELYQWFEKQYNPYATKEFAVVYETKSISEIRERIRSFGVTQDVEKRIADMEKEVLKIQKMKEDIAKVQARIKKENEMRNELKKVAFKCYEMATAH